VTEVKLHLHKEGYRHELIEGPLLAKQLMEAIEKARAVWTVPAKRAARERARR
jgi:hypothetical protein